MEPMAAFRLAVAEIGDGNAEELSSLIERKYGLKIDRIHIPIYRASLRDLRRRDLLREARKAAIELPTNGRSVSE